MPLRFPPATSAITAALLIAFAVQNLLGDVTMLPFALWPPGHEPIGVDEYGAPIVAGFAPLQMLTYGFLHGNLTHLLLNLFGLLIFAPDVERMLGVGRFVLLYAACLAAAALAQLVTAHLEAAFYPTVGASGAIYGVIVAAAMLFPERQIFLIFPPIHLSARAAALLMVVAEVVHGVLGTQAGVAHFAHLGGAVVGFLLILLWRPRAAER
jgi:membrane associated rhomboid family serine protease